MDHTYAVIMAGGGGTRLWPISRRKHPKHVLPLLGDRTLFQITLDRLAGFVSVDRVIIVTTAEQKRELISQAPQIPSKNFLIEPMPRGTASVVGLAAIVLAKRDPQAVMLVLPSDHYIRNNDIFHKVMRIAVKVARNGYLVTLGITPSFPATGYGYIQMSGMLQKKYDLPVFKVMKFTEKPSEENAIRMLAGGDHTWNSGMFIWRVDRILEEIGRQMPDLKAILERIGSVWGTPEQEVVLASDWPKLKSETIDYSIMEAAADVAVLPVAGLEWSDVGSWDSLYDVTASDANGNVVVKGEHLPIETHGTLVYSSGKKLIVTIGVNDMIIIDSGDALLVCPRDQAQQVRQVIANLKAAQREDYL